MKRAKSLPDRNDGREENEEAEDVDEPLTSKAVKGNEKDRKSECDSAEDLCC